MEQLQNKLSDEYVNKLANARKVEFRGLGGYGKNHFAIIYGDLYVKEDGYRILKRNFLEYEAEVKENGYPLKDAA